jgi:uncharacterized membrane protein YccC
MHSAAAPARTGFWKTVTRFDTAKIAPWMALRNSIGVALPLAVGALVGDPRGGLVMSSGALNVSFSDGYDPYLHRARRMLASSLCCALAVLAGGLCGRSPALVALAAAVCAFGAGMMVAVNSTAADIGTITLVTLVVFSAQGMSPYRALIAGLLALGGGLLQTALALALWPMRRYAPERKVLAALYHELARAAASGAPAGEAPPASEQSTLAQTALASLGGDRSMEAVRYLALLAQAERIRLALLMLFRLRIRIGREPQTAPSAVVLGRASELISGLLDSIGDSLSADRPADPHPKWLAELHAIAESLLDHDGDAMLRDARWQIEAINGQIRSAAELAGHLTPQGRMAFERREATQPRALRLAGTLAAVRANLNLNSATFRHAVRLAVCVALGEWVGRLLSSPRSYWLPMTIAIVLKPDFTATFSRGLLRLSGTLAGLLLATAIFHFLPPAIAVEGAFITAFAFLLRCFGPANYGVLVTALTALVVVMFAVTGIAPSQVIAARGLNTLIGGLIALTAYRLWPTWEDTQVGEAVARMLDAYRSYFATVRDAYLKPEQSFAAPLDHTRLAARLARSNLEASVGRLRAEPGVPAERLGRLDMMLATSHRFIHAAMALEAGLAQSRPVPAREAFRTFANDADLMLSKLAAALRGTPVSPGELPDLREDHNALLQAGDPLVERYALVNIETDRVTNTLNTLAEQIVRRIQESPA